MGCRDANCTGYEGAIPESWNTLTHKIIGPAMEVHTRLEPGLPECVYERAMVIELRLRGLTVEQQVRFNVQYKGQLVGEQVVDLLVARLVVLELKSIEAVPNVHLAKLMGYLHVSDMPLGLLINFHVLLLKDGIFRRMNPRSSTFKNQSPAPCISS
jgi:GxxExxY protein